MSDDIGTYLRAHRDRCTVCGWHPEAQGHDPNVLHVVATPEGNLRPIPPDPMTASREATALPTRGVFDEPTRGVFDEPIVTRPAPERIERPW